MNNAQPPQSPLCENTPPVFKIGKLKRAISRISRLDVDFHDQDDELAVVDLAQQATVPDSMMPESIEFSAKRLADLARVFGIFNPLVEEGASLSIGKIVSLWARICFGSMRDWAAL